MSLSSHQRGGGHDEWLTPPEILAHLGTFDLDPCAPIVRPWDTATKHYTVEDDGLAQKWEGRVWMNPPFGKEAAKWLRAMSIHRNGIALVAARTETRAWFDYVWPCAFGILFLRGRPHFHYVDGTKAKANSGAPICLIAYSDADMRVLYASGLGAVVQP